MKTSAEADEVGALSSLLWLQALRGASAPNALLPARGQSGALGL